MSHEHELAHAIREFTHELREFGKRDSHWKHKIMTALETLTGSVNANTAGQAELTIAVNAAIVQLGSPGATDAQLLTLSTAIDSSTASDAALTAALKAAVTPPVEPPTV